MGAEVSATEPDPIILRPQPGPQELFLSTEADIAIFGGSAGGGKSYALLLEAMRHLNNPRFGGVIFRRTSPELTGAGSIWEEAREMCPPLGCEMIETPTLKVKYPKGGVLELRHLQHSKDVYSHHGKQYDSCSFDEMSHFTEDQFWYLVSRLRSVSGVKSYFRGTTNPDPDSFVRTLIDWWIGDLDCPECDSGECRKAEHGYPIPERSGVLRWFTRISGELWWGDSRAEVEDYIRSIGLEPGKDAGVRSFTFIPSKLEDNPALLAKNPEYRATLLSLPEVEKQRLLLGNWNIRPAAGKYIKAEYLKARWTGKPANLPPLNIYTASDYAVTPEDEAADPDYTEHGVFGVSPDDDIYVLDWWFGRTASDEWVERLIDLWAKWKPIKAFGESGQIRRAVEPFLRKRMQERKIYVPCEWIGAPRGEKSPTKQGYADRSKRAKAIKGRSFQARSAMGKVIFPAHPAWAARVVSQCVGFPQGHDDAFDVVALMCMAIDKAYAAAPPPEERPPEKDRWARAFKRQHQVKSGWKTA